VDYGSQIAYGDESDKWPPPPYPQNPPTSTGIYFPDINNPSIIVEGQNYGTRGITNIGSSSGSDCHIFFYLAGYNMLCESYSVSNGPGQPVSLQGTCYFQLDNNQMRPLGWTSAEAGGMAMIPREIDPYEVYGTSAPITHPLAISMNHTQSQNPWLWPASHIAGVNSAIVPRMGAWWRLKASYDISGYPPDCQKILQCLKDYGAIVGDNGGSFFVQGRTGPTNGFNWNDNQINALKGVHGNDGDFIDVSALQVAPDSYAAGAAFNSLPSSAGGITSAGTTADFSQAHHSKSPPRAH
jgi:hypothetical protein